MADKAEKLSVVIPVRNEAAGISRCIEGILGQTCGIDEIIVLDSRSTDGTREILSKYDRVRVIDIDPSTFDHGMTRNIGARESRCEWVLMTVGDAWPADEKWIERLFDGVSDEEVAGVCGSQIVPHDKSANPLTWFRPVSPPTLERRQFGSSADFDALSPGERMRVCRWDDVTALYRRSVLTTLPFRATKYGEDALWARDALRAGYALAFNSAARVYHYHVGSELYTYARTLAVAHMRYSAFGYLHEVPPLASPMLRAVYRLVRDPALTWRERAHWAASTWNAQRAARRALGAYRSAALDGRAEAERLYERYCNTPPLHRGATTLSANDNA